MAVVVDDIARTAGGAVCHTLHPTFLGPVLLAADGDGVIALGLPQQGRAPATQPWGRRDDRAAPFLAVAAQLDEYLAGTRRDFDDDLPLAPRGSAFQQALWARLRRVPFATTTSYAALADEMGRPGAARAVGGANARNPIAVIVPCHRVVAASGALTGYAGGLDNKRWLLDHERAVLAAAGADGRRAPAIASAAAGEVGR